MKAVIKHHVFTHNGEHDLDDHYLPRWVRELVGFCASFTLISLILIITLIGWI